MRGIETQILHRLMLVVISHAHFDHFAYLTSLILYYSVLFIIHHSNLQNHPRSFLLPILLPPVLAQYYSSLFGESLERNRIRLIPIGSDFIQKLTPLSQLGHCCPVQSPEDIMEQTKCMQLGNGIGIRLLRNNHNSMSFAIVSLR